MPQITGLLSSRVGKLTQWHVTRSTDIKKIPESVSLHMKPCISLAAWTCVVPQLVPSWVISVHTRFLGLTHTGPSWEAAAPRSSWEHRLLRRMPPGSSFPDERQTGGIFTGFRGCWQDCSMPGITTRGPGELPASPGGEEPGGGEGKGTHRWDRRDGIFAHSCLRAGLLGAPGTLRRGRAVRAKGWEAL